MKRLYVLVRRDLPRSVQAVQAAHAVAQYVYDFRNTVELEWGKYGPTIAMLAVDNRAALDNWQKRLASRGQVAVFREPDLADQPTALAFYGEKQVGLSSLRLL